MNNENIIDFLKYIKIPLKSNIWRYDKEINILKIIIIS